MPLAPGLLQIDLIAALKLPVILVVHDKLGAINHTLLSLEACRHRNILIHGVILNRASTLDGNQKSIEEYGNIPVLGRFFEKPLAEVVRDIASLLGRPVQTGT